MEALHGTAGAFALVEIATRTAYQVCSARNLHDRSASAGSLIRLCPRVYPLFLPAPHRLRDRCRSRRADSDPPQRTATAALIAPARGPPAWNDAPEPMSDWDLLGQPEPDFAFDPRIAWSPPSPAREGAVFPVSRLPAAPEILVPSLAKARSCTAHEFCQPPWWGLDRSFRPRIGSRFRRPWTRRGAWICYPFRHREGNNMAATIGEQLKHFMMSVDFVDSDLCRSVRTLLDRHLAESLAMKHYHVMMDGTRVKGKPALRTAVTAGLAWTNENQDTIPVQEESGSYKGQSTYAYEKDMKLWVTAPLVGDEHKPLNETETYVDQWSKTKNIPAYFSEDKPTIRTSIVCPLKYGDRVFGFLCLESEQYLECSDYARREIQALADAVAIVLWLHQGYLKQQDSRRHAFSVIESTVKEKGHLLSPLSKPKVFFASSSRADREVVGVVRDILQNELGPSIQEVFWREIKDPGDINAQVIREINECRFGICYLSEPTASNSGTKIQFVDNLNVVFEAGMLQSLSSASSETPESWIPLREPNSPPAPFDIAHQRTLLVTRLNDGSLNKDSFHADLLARISNLLGVSAEAAGQASKC